VSDGHVSQAADRLAATRVRRAAAARAVKSAGTASPMPKYLVWRLSSKRRMWKHVVVFVDVERLCLEKSKWPQETAFADRSPSVSPRP
jgi:hypothetical protein